MQHPKTTYFKCPKVRGRSASTSILSQTSSVHFLKFSKRQLWVLKTMKYEKPKSTDMYNSNRPSHIKQNTTEPHPEPHLEITVHSFLRPRALEIAFEFLGCVNSHFQMGHIHLESLLTSQIVSRGHQIFNLNWYCDQFTSPTREGRTYLATVEFFAYPRIEGLLAVTWCSLERSCLSQ